MKRSQSIVAKLVRGATPLQLRISLAAYLGRNPRIPYIGFLPDALVRDLLTIDPKRYHKFLWEKHFSSYGRKYEPADLFSERRLNGTIKAYSAFIKDLSAALDKLNIGDDIRSVLDVGCSAGHILRSLEEEVFMQATVLVGVDIDRHAIQSGKAYLSKIGSKVRLVCGDLEDLDQLLENQVFDFSFAAGSLSYLNETDAQEALSEILAHTDKLVTFIGLANPNEPNSELAASVLRDDLGSMWTHNFGAMAEAEGWEVVGSRWQPPSGTDTQGLYFIFAAPPGSLSRE